MSDSAEAEITEEERQLREKVRDGKLALLRCETCGTVFGVPPYRRGTARYCSVECKGEGQRGPRPDERSRVEIECEQCGEDFEVQPHRADSGRFCSQDCKAQAAIPARRRRETLECDHCGDEYEVKAHQAEDSQFCSQDCYHAWRREEKPRRSRVEIECERCGDVFEVQPHRADSARFCSQDCTRNRVTLSCDECGDDFEVQPYRADSARFCSVECRTEAGVGGYPGDSSDDDGESVKESEPARPDDAASEPAAEPDRPEAVPDVESFAELETPRWLDEGSFYGAVDMANDVDHLSEILGWEDTDRVAVAVQALGLDLDGAAESDQAEAD